MEKRISDRGYYPVRLTRDEVDAWSADATLVDTRFKAEMLAIVERWMALGDERLAGTGHPLHRLAGERRHVRDRPDHRARRASSSSARRTRSTLDGFTLVSTGWANPTPWNTFRELPEPELRERIDGLVGHGRRPAPGDLQLPRPAVRLEPRQRAQARCRHELRVRRPGAGPGRLEGGPRVDPRVRPATVAPRPHPRGQGRGQARAAPWRSTLAAPTRTASSRRPSSTSTRRRGR